MKSLCSIFPFLLAVLVFSQERKGELTKEIGFISDNDSYLMLGNDGYYTNGLDIYMNWKGKNAFKIHSLQIGQLMFNAQNGDFSKIEKMDRPITAYLHLTYKQTQFTTKRDLLNWGISLGAIGPIALGKEAQVGLHKILNQYDPKKEWEFQLKNSIGINGEFTWAREIPIKSNFEVQTISKARAGFFFTNIELGGLLRWGKFNDNTHTTLWNTKLNAKDKKSRKELFFYFHPSLSVYAYNATVQGGLFRGDKGPVIGKLNPFLYHHSVGVMGSWNRFSANLSVNYQTKETSLQKRTQWYGTIELKYLL